ncbi:tRNA (adenine(58)-N(1))-methyltransferase non-catalytic subunit [Podosphaera aphanis]|nr:tRNA (adenine(58)-N(1))-methyltransferase non-catalytic subunit [Podosphaera aphanis]
MHNRVEPYRWIFLKLASSSLKIVHAVPNTIVNIPKYGSFSVNLLLSRPYYFTYELLDRLPDQKYSLLRVVPASELHADIKAEEENAVNPEQVLIKDGVEYELTDATGQLVMRSNREIIDSASRQTLTMAEIEELKKEGTGAGKDLIEKLMASHIGIEQKTTFSLAKYKLMKTKKYLKRFTVLPVDVSLLTKWITEEKDAGKILELREEMLALIGSWANVHFSSVPPSLNVTTPETATVNGRWLVVDETGGLLVASIAERMGILYPDPRPSSLTKVKTSALVDEELPLAKTNTITLVHNNAQPNLSLMKYFSFTPDDANSNTTIGKAVTPHPLSRHLLPINWLQVLSPHQDITYSTAVPYLDAENLGALKSGKRGTYYRKHRRWARARHIVSDTQRGNFDGIAVASQMDPISVLRPLLPLLRGGAQVCVYSPYIEPLTILADVFSMNRRTAFIHSPPEEFACLPISLPLNISGPDVPLSQSPSPSAPNTPSSVPLAPDVQASTSTLSVKNHLFTKATWPGSSDFPLNPTLLLNTTIQSARVREWQVLPGRTHPVMTGRGGAEGYLFTGVKVLPAEGKVEARGKFARKRGAVGKEKETEEKKVRVEVESK